MSYERNITAVVEEVLKLPEIRHEIDDPRNNISADYLRRRLQQRDREIFEEAKKAIDDFESLEQEVESQKIELATLEKTPGDVETIQNTFGCLGCLITVVALGLVGGGTAVTLWEVFVSNWYWPLIAGVVGAAIVVAVFAASRRIYIWYRGELPKLRQESTAKRDSAEIRLKAARVAADNAVQTAARQNAIALINDATEPFFQERLLVPIPGRHVVSAEEKEVSAEERGTTAVGLSEVLNPISEIATDARQSVMRMLETLPGANIGVAGPRGVGKSTLLWSLCGSNPKINGREAIAFYTAAPVEYDSREFLLHLYSSLCRQVLKSKGVQEDRSFTTDDDMAEQQGIRGLLLQNQSHLGWILIIVGVVLLALGLIVATLLSADLNKALDLKPGPLVQWGGAGFLVGSILLLYDKFIRIGEQLAARGRQLRSQLWVRQARLSAEQADDLALQCQRALRDIRFQKSYSSGWSGALKIPAGFENSANKVISFAQKQQSLPELVQEFRDFIGIVTTTYARDGTVTPVVIAIDELDKLASAKKAQQFVNEIKAIFSVPNCF
jgi:hypothetical protein